jgi:hypothetical protein
MRRTILPVLSAAAFAAAVALTLPSPAHSQGSTAQAPPAREAQWSVVMVSKIKPEFRTEYEAYTKQISAALKKAEVPSRVVLTTVMGDLNEYVSITPVAKFAQLDGPTPIERALGKEEADKLLKRGSMFIQSLHRFATLSSPEVSLYSDSKEPPALSMVSFVRLLPGKGPAYNEWLKNEYVPAMQKAEVKDLWISRNIFGGNSNDRVIVRPIKAMAEIDGGPILTKALGREASQKLMLSGSALTETTETRIMRYRPDLSYRLAGSTQQAKK